MQEETKKYPQEKPQVNTDLKHLEERIAEIVGVPVMIQQSAKGKGKLILKYNSLDELDGVLQHLGYRESWFLNHHTHTAHKSFLIQSLQLYSL